MKFLCEQCKAKYQIADDKVAGKTVRMKCRRCGHLIEVRAAVTESSVASGPLEGDRPSAPPRSSSLPSTGRRPPPPRAPAMATSFAGSKAAPRQEHPPLATGALEGAFKAVVQRRDEEVSAPFDMSDLSPSDEWYVAINGVPVGPIRVAEVRRKAALGAVSEESLVWQEGLDEWRPLGSFPELAASVREAMSSARASRPPQSEVRSSMPPPPPARGPSSSRAAPAASSPPRIAPPRIAASLAPPAQSARSNVVPFLSRLATAEKLDDVLHPGTSPSPGTLSATAGPIPSVVPDPFANPAAAASLAVRESVPASLPPSPRKSPPWMALAMIAAALAFGVTAALTVFLRPASSPTPPVVLQAPAPPPVAATPTTGAIALPLPATESPEPPAPATTTTTKARSSGASQKGAAAESPTSTGRSLDLHALTQNAPTVTPTDDPSTDAPKAAGQCFSQGQVQQVIGLHQTGIRRACWERNPTTKPTVNVEVLMTIAENGTAQNVSASGDEPSVSKCIENDVRGWRFPAAGCSQKTSFSLKFVRQ